MNATSKTPISPLIIFGSARGDGHTMAAVNLVIGNHKVPIIDLQDLTISHYDYDSKNKDDDFIPLAEKMVDHNPLILATPVYWYSMSALMKTFVDRWSDLITIRKDLGRKLVGKDLYVITSYGGTLPKGFEHPFSQTCDFLKMNYRGCFYYYSGENLELLNRNSQEAEHFAKTLPF
jgi:multimeric flavodoxin WrbA